MRYGRRLIPSQDSSEPQSSRSRYWGLGHSLGRGEIGTYSGGLEEPWKAGQTE
jgi:hypothetical protein